MNEEAASPSLGEACGARAAAGAGPKAALVAAVAEAIRRMSLAQTEAARLCRTDQPTLSKVLRGQHGLVSLDKLLGWLTALGVGVEIRLDPDGPAGGVAVRDGAAASSEAEERFRALAAATSEGVAIHDGERVVEANDALCAIYGYEREEVIGRDPRDFLAPGMAARSEALAAAGHGEPYETLGRRKDGGTFPVELCGKSITYRGRPVRVVTARDLTARKAAEAALREGEERLRLAQEAAGIGTWDWDLGTGAIRWSPEMYRVLGLDPERDGADPYGAWLRALHPDDRERADAEARGRLMNVAEPFVSEFRIVRPDGEVRWIMVRGRALRGPGGWPARVVGVNIDVTARRAAEAALRDSEARFRLLAEAMPGLVFVADAAGRNLYTNQRFQDYTGLSAEQLLGEGWLQALHPDDRARAAAAWGSAVAARTSYEAEYRFRGRDGGYRWFLGLGLPALGPEGRVGEWFGVAIDIDDRRAAEEALRRSEELRRLALEAAGLGVLDAGGPDGTLLVDQRFRELYGLGPDEVPTPEAIWARLHPGDLVRVRAALDGAREPGSGRAYEAEYRVVLPDGAERWHLARGRFGFDEAARPARFVGVMMDVTARQAAEAALRGSEARFRAIAETSHEGIWLVDAEARTLFINERMAGLLGYAADEIVGHAVPEFVFAGDIPAVKERVGANLAGETQQFDFRFRRRDGSALPVLAATSPMRDPEGRIVGALGMFSDLTGRNAADAALRESEGRYRALTEMSPDAVYVHRDGIIILANPRAAALFGARDPDELVGRQVFSLVDPESRGLAQARTARLARPGDHNEPVRLVFRRVDGSRFVVEASSAAVLLDGRPAVQAVLRDVTARETAEAALRRSEELRRLALDAGELGLWDLDYVMLALDFDGRFCELMGFEPGEEVTNATCWARIHPEDRPAVEAAVERAKDPVGGGAYEAEYRVLLPDGVERWHLSRAQVRFDGEGEARRPVRFVGVMMDVTQRHAVEEALRASEARFRAVLTGSPVFVYDMGPDLRYRWVCNPPPPLAPEDWVGKRDDETAPPEHAGPRMALKRSVIESGRNARAEVTHDRGGGDVRTYDLSLEAVRDSTGRVVGLRGAAVDITERKAADAARAASEERLRLAVETTGLGIFDVDPVTGERRWSDEYKAILGLPPDTPPDPEVHAAAIHPEDRGWVNERYWGVYRGENGGRYDAEYRILRADDGAERWVHNTGLVRFDAAGRAVRAVGTLIDVTERKQAEAAMRENEARYRTVFEQAAVGIKQMALADGRILAANGALCRMLGYTAEKLVGLRTVDIIHPEDLAVEQAQLARLLAGEIASYAIEKRYLRKGGAPVWVRVTTSIPRTAAARERYRISVVEDVTARKQAEEHQRLLLGELSHRVKNMLAVVRGIALHSLGSGRPLGEAREILEQRLTALATAHGLLTATDWRGASLRDLVAAEIAPYEGRVAVEGSEVMLPPNVALSLALVLHELATNALKYGALSAPGGRVRVRWSRQGGKLRLAWREEGGPAVVPPTRRGFGSMLIERSVAHNLGGTARLDFRPEGLAYEVELPLEPG